MGIRWVQTTPSETRNFFQVILVTTPRPLEGVIPKKGHQIFGQENVSPEDNPGSTTAMLVNYAAQDQRVTTKPNPSLKPNQSVTSSFGC